MLLSSRRYSKRKNYPLENSCSSSAMLLSRLSNMAEEHSCAMGWKAKHPNSSMTSLRLLLYNQILLTMAPFIFPMLLLPTNLTPQLELGLSRAALNSDGYRPSLTNIPWDQNCWTLSSSTNGVRILSVRDTYHMLIAPTTNSLALTRPVQICLWLTVSKVMVK